MTSPVNCDPGLHASHPAVNLGRALMALVAASFLVAGSTAHAQIVHVNYSGGWVVSPVVSGDYTSVTGVSSAPANVYGAKAGAGVDLVSGGSASQIISSTNYVDLSARTDGSGTMWGVNTTGGVDWLNYSGGWVVSPLVTGNYVSVANQSSSNTAAYAARADGGIDMISYSGGWGASTLLGGPTKYVDLAATQASAADGFLWGVTDAGGINLIAWSGSWGATSILSGDYISVTARSTDGYIYASKASGGIDLISWSGSWSASPIISGSAVFGDLATDLAGNDFIYATVPEPAPVALLMASLFCIALVPRLRKKALA